MYKIKTIAKNIFSITYNLFKVMIPTIVIVKILEDLGFVVLLNNFLSPLMSLLDLPQELSIVFTTTMLTNIYSGLVIFSGINLESPLSSGQVSILGLLMLFTHSLPLEAMICRKAGVRIRVVLFTRLFIGFLACFILNKIIIFFGLLNEQAVIIIPQTTQQISLYDWVNVQLKMLSLVCILITTIVIVLEIFKYLKIQKLIELSLKPFLSFLNIGKEASTIVLVGATLGISFGGGLLIQEVKSGKIYFKDVFGALVLLGLFHSLIEDTGLVSLMGANIIIIFFIRVLIALLVTCLLIKLLSKSTDLFWKKHLINNNIKEKTHD